MNITEITLRNFRNYASLVIAPCHSVNAFIGENAQGKTNILEAAYLCMTARSHRTSRDQDMIAWGAEASFARVMAESEYGAQDIEVRLNPHGKAIRIGGLKRAKTGDLLGRIPGVMFSPEDLRIIKDGPSARRRFMDIELSQMRPAYYLALTQYARALKQRNELLKQRAAPHLVDAFDEQLSQNGGTIIMHRHEFLCTLQPIAQARHAEIAGDNELLSLKYECGAGHPPETDVAAWLLSRLKESRAHDIQRGATTVGCHRDDIAAYLNDHDARGYASQGQMRTLALALKLSELTLMRAETGITPILMLDDVLSELDPARRRHLLSCLDSVQTFITCTAQSDLAEAHCGAMFSVHAGNAEMI